MAIKPYASKVTVQPVSSVNTAGIIKAGQIGAQSMLGAARVMSTIGNMAYKKGAEVATKEGEERAAEVELLRDESGQTISPDDLPESDRIYDQVYRATVLNKYKNDITLDVSKKLQQLAIDNQFEPEVFEAQASEYLKATTDVVDPSVRIAVAKAGGERKRQHYASLTNKHQSRTNRQFVDSSNTIISQLDSEAKNGIITDQEGTEAQKETVDRLVDTIKKLRPHIGSDNVKSRLESLSRQHKGMRMFVGFRDLDDVERSEVIRDLVSGTGELFNKKSKRYSEFLTEMPKREKDNLINYLRTYIAFEKKVNDAEDEVTKGTISIAMTSMVWGSANREERAGMNLLIRNIGTEAWENTKPKDRLRLLQTTVREVRARSEKRYTDGKRAERDSKDLETKLLHKDATLVLSRELVKYPEVYRNLQNLLAGFTGEFDEKGKAIIDPSRAIKDPQVEFRLVKSTFQHAMNNVKDDTTLKIFDLLKGQTLTAAKQLGLDGTKLIAEVVDSPQPDQQLRHLRALSKGLITAATKARTDLKKMAPMIAAYASETSMLPSSDNGKYVMAVLNKGGVDTSDIDNVIRHGYLGIPDSYVKAMSQAVLSGSKDVKTVQFAVQLFQAYNIQPGNDKHLRKQLGGDIYNQLRIISTFGSKFEAPGMMEAVARVVDPTRKKEEDIHAQIKYAFGPEFIKTDGSLNNPKIKQDFEATFQAVSPRMVQGEDDTALGNLFRSLWKAPFSKPQLTQVEKDALPKITYSSAPKKFMEAVYNRYYINVGKYAGHGDSMAGSDGITVGARREALKNAISSVMGNPYLGGWGWSVMMAPQSDYFTGQFKLRKNAPEVLFKVSDPLSPEGVSIEYLATEGMANFKSQLGKAHDKLKHGYSWGKNIFLIDSGKVGPEGKPLYNVQAADDTIEGKTGYGHLIRDKNGKEVLINFAPMKENEEHRVIWEQADLVYKASQRHERNVTAHHASEDERERKLGGGPSFPKSGEKLRVKVPPYPIRVEPINPEESGWNEPSQGNPYMGDPTDLFGPP